MPKLKAGSLFSGYGGLDIAVEAVFGAELTWIAEFDPAPSKVMDRHWPGVPNYGDVTAVDWSAVEPVDIISGGSPCQDVSAAGRRAGMTDGTRSNLWVAMREAIAQIKPTYVIWENVRGAHSATAYSAVESEPGLLGETGAAYLRATGRVLGDLAQLGYDAQWRTISASSVGAPHRRERVFVLAWRRDTVAENRDGRRAGRGDHAPRQSRRGRQDGKTRLPGGSPGGTGSATPVALLPTPVAQPSGNSPEDHLRKKPGRERVTDLAIMVENNLLSTGGKLLPTVEARSFKGRNGGANKGFTADINHAVESLLPTPKAGDVDFGLPRTSGRPPERSTHLATRLHYTIGEGRNGDPAETRPSEVLPGVRSPASPEEVQEWEAGGPNSVPEAQTLLSELREQAPDGASRFAALGGTQDQGEKVLRDLRDEESLARSSQGQEPGEQQPREPASSLRQLPPETSLERGTRAQGGAETAWGDYGPAIRRWEAVLGREAPPPTEPSPRGKQRLSAAFCEWMMGLPAGWICDTEGITRKDAIKMAGNGVVTQQSYAALTDMLLTC